MKQTEIRPHRLIELSRPQSDFVATKKKFSCFAGGVGSGKSFCGCIKVMMHAEFFPNNLLLVGRKTFTLLRDSTLQDFLSIYGYRKDIKFDKANSIMTLANGSKILFRHLDDINALKNLNLGGFWIDQAEEIPESVYNLLVARLRRHEAKHHFAAITCNAEAHNWIWRRWKRRKEIGALPEDHILCEATTFDNEANLPDNYIRDMMNTWPAEIVKQYIYNSWEAGSGLILPELEEQVHYIPGFAIPAHWQRLVAIDHGVRSPTAVLFGAIDEEGNMYIYDEHYMPEKTVPYHAAVIKNKVAKSDWGGTDQTIDMYLIDPMTRSRTREKDGKLWSVMEEYLDKGIPVLPADNDIPASIDLLKQRLHYTYDQQTKLLTKPKLHIFHNCTNLWDEMVSWKWKMIRGTNEVTGEQRYTNEPDPNAANHAIDALRYLVLSRPLPSYIGSPKEFRPVAGRLDLQGHKDKFEGFNKYEVDDAENSYVI